MEADLREALAAGSLKAPGLSGGGSIFERTPQGRVVFRVARDEEGQRCVLLDRRAGNACAVHSDLGAPRQAAACRLFPRVALSAPDAVSLTLSHYCPTAAELLFGETPLAIEEKPSAFPDGIDYEGLDATRSLGPWLRPGVLLGWDALRLLERHIVALLDGVGPVEDALQRLTTLGEDLRRWTVDDGDFAEYFGRHLEALHQTKREDGTPGREALVPPVALGSGGDLGLWRLAASAVPDALPRPSDPYPTEGTPAVRELLDCWSRFARPVRRWVAARAFASWLMLQGDGLRSFLAGLHVATAVLRAEAVRGCREASRPLDRELLREAFRRADLLLVHLADPEALARQLSAVERRGRR